MSNCYKTIKLKKNHQIAWITLNRKDKLNAINSLMLQELSEAVNSIEKDVNIRCVVISGEGDRAFSAGADIKELQKLTSETALEFAIKGQQVFSRLEGLSKPVIAAISGYALGGGLELALACDFRIASDGTELGCPEIKLGFIPAWGGTQRLPRVVGALEAKRLIMTGNRISAIEAFKIGLVDKVVPSKHLQTEVQELAKRLTEHHQAVLKHAKLFKRSIANDSFNSELKKDTDAFVQLFSLKKTKDEIGAFGSHKNKK